MLVLVLTCIKCPLMIQDCKKENKWPAPEKFSQICSQQVCDYCLKASLKFLSLMANMFILYPQKSRGGGQKEESGNCACFSLRKVSDRSWAIAPYLWRLITSHTNIGKSLNSPLFPNLLRRKPNDGGRFASPPKGDTNQTDDNSDVLAAKMVSLGVKVQALPRAVVKKQEEILRTSISSGIEASAASAGPRTRDSSARARGGRSGKTASSSSGRVPDKRHALPGGARKSWPAGARDVRRELPVRSSTSPSKVGSAANAVYGAISMVPVETAKFTRKESTAGNSSAGVGSLLPDHHVAVSNDKANYKAASRKGGKRTELPRRPELTKPLSQPKSIRPAPVGSVAQPRKPVTAGSSNYRADRPTANRNRSEARHQAATASRGRGEARHQAAIAGMYRRQQAWREAYEAAKRRLESRKPDGTQADRPIMRKPAASTNDVAWDELAAATAKDGYHYDPKRKEIVIDDPKVYWQRFGKNDTHAAELNDGQQQKLRERLAWQAHERYKAEVRRETAASSVKVPTMNDTEHFSDSAESSVEPTDTDRPARAKHASKSTAKSHKGTGPSSAVRDDAAEGNDHDAGAG